MPALVAARTLQGYSRNYIGAVREFEPGQLLKRGLNARLRSRSSLPQFCFDLAQFGAVSPAEDAH